MLDADVRSLADTMAAVAQNMNRRVPLEETLTAIVISARDTIPGVDHAGVSITQRRGRIQTAAATDPLVYEADALQYQLNEGPCLDAIRGKGQTIVNDLATDPRWPSYGPKGAALGIGSQLGIELYDEPDTLGALNLYARDTDALSESTLHMAHLFAVHSALALGRAISQSQLTEAVGTRQLVGQAIGIVMERYQMDEARAFNYLVRVSQNGNLKLRAVAEELVKQTAQRQA